MPRPYNLILGEGTVKNQRRGRGLGEVVIDTTAASFNTLINSDFQTVYDQILAFGNGQAASAADYMNSVNEFQANPSGYGGANAVAGSTVGAWIQNNMTLLLLGGVAGLFLFRKR